MVGSHPASPALPFYVGSATGSEANNIRSWPKPLVCWKVEDVRFAFDSSFVTYNTDPLTNPSDPTSDPLAKPFTNNDIRDELKLLASQIQLNPGCPLAVFGHADPVGPAVDPDGYNKALSGRRATSIYALLISATQPAKAVSLWQTIATNPNEHWGTSQSQVMQAATGLPAGTSMNDLITSYIPKLVPPEYSALKIGPSNFLAQGADPLGKGDYQGCSAFNPLVIFSQDEQDSFAGADDPTSQAYADRNLANAPNRRVMVLLFTKGSKVDPAKWPCPRASDDKSGCIKRFWSNGDTRRFTRLPDDNREYAKTKDTFACRFYDRLMQTSPCYQRFWVVRLLDSGFQPLSERKPLANLPYSVTGVDGTDKPFQGTTDQDGVLRIPVIAYPATMTLTIVGLQITLDGGSLVKIKTDQGVEQRLSNLGYLDTDSDGGSSTDSGANDSASDDQSTPQSLADALTLFQQNNNLPVTNGVVDSTTRNSLKQYYGC